MRKTNNQKSGSVTNSFWVVYDPTTDEFLTQCDTYGLEYCSWGNLILEEGVGDLERLDESARFSTLRQAQDAAEWLACKLSERYSGEEIVLQTACVTSAMVEMVTDVSWDTDSVTHSCQAQEQEDQEEEEEGEAESQEEEEESEVDIDWRRQEAQARAAAEARLTEVKARKKKKSAKSKK
jgi:hypothetical protein